VSSGGITVAGHGDFIVGQERFEDCDVGLDFRDVNVQLGQPPPDLVIARS
jgi:hypothetical protein